MNDVGDVLKVLEGGLSLVIYVIIEGQLYLVHSLIV